MIFKKKINWVKFLYKVMLFLNFIFKEVLGYNMLFDVFFGRVIVNMMLKVIIVFDRCVERNVKYSLKIIFFFSIYKVG